MVFSKAFALAAIFATLTSAAPMQQKRAVVYETVTEVDVTTIDTTITIYPGEATPTVSGGVAAATTTAAAVTTAAPVEEQVASASSSSSSSSSTSSYVPAPETSSPSSTTEAAPTTVAPTTTAAPQPPAPTTTSSSSSSSSSSSTSTSSTSSAPASSSTSRSTLSGDGDGTYYDTATSMSSPSYCDTANDGETENVVALSYEVMDESLCGASITVEYEGKTATGTVVDKCMGCDAQAIDMSRAMFGDLSDLSAGRITVSWSVN
ncbi:hypothetical protein UA08_05758 [Talaromyces atroroseus]|uniref:RlpA-like protein double-psi beta-barrel domain-containing protein n=1 Tax=Talaromyces atroroseus TaxID=1441469 RepID=A0A225AZM7_TALAT|nr:hypothetical protein UA08_05758 [Talaromyces atroroseus]OKL58977.1 hypothetical protein UA08_05758 [Talaromyces atroroseus]